MLRLAQITFLVTIEITTQILELMFEIPMHPIRNSIIHAHHSWTDILLACASTVHLSHRTQEIYRGLNAYIRDCKR